ncbi:MAG: hypothetical protein SVE93_04200, partial [Candidatus Thermoplasmatota archaeon]|nr:hypothetical protein [Candidatus Thermoplasmatota archaeon]
CSIPLSILFFLASGLIKMLTWPVVYCFPLLYSFLGLMGGNPNFFIGGIGDLLGHLFVDAGSSLSSLILCLPLGSCFITFGDLITLCGNGFSVLVVGDLFTALQQFFGAFMLSIITLLSILNLCPCCICCCAPCSCIFALVLEICTDLIALATDLLGQVITYCRPALAALLH